MDVARTLLLPRVEFIAAATGTIVVVVVVVFRRGAESHSDGDRPAEQVHRALVSECPCLVPPVLSPMPLWCSVVVDIATVGVVVFIILTGAV